MDTFEGFQAERILGFGCVAPVHTADIVQDEVDHIWLLGAKNGDGG